MQRGRLLTLWVYDRPSSEMARSYNCFDLGPPKYQQSQLASQNTEQWKARKQTTCYINLPQKYPENQDGVEFSLNRHIPFQNRNDKKLRSPRCIWVCFRKTQDDCRKALVIRDEVRRSCFHTTSALHSTHLVPKELASNINNFEVNIANEEVSHLLIKVVNSCTIQRWSLR